MILSSWNIRHVTVLTGWPVSCLMQRKTPLQLYIYDYDGGVSKPIGSINTLQQFLVYWYLVYVHQFVTLKYLSR